MYRAFLGTSITFIKSSHYLYRYFYLYLFAFLLPGKNGALEASTHLCGRRTGVEMQEIQLSLHALHLEARLSLRAFSGIAYSFAPVYSTATFAAL